MLGYRIIDGKAMIDETEACVIRAIFSGYISGMSLRETAETEHLLYRRRLLSCDRQQADIHKGKC